MPIALKREDAVEPAKDKRHKLLHLIWLGLACLFVFVLMATYGLDLTPGLF